MITLTRSANLAAAAVVLGLQGCAFYGLDLENRRTLSITKPPYQIVISGDLSEKDKLFVAQTLRFLERQRFQDYNFSGVKVDVNGHHPRRIRYNTQINNEN